MSRLVQLLSRLTSFRACGGATRPAANAVPSAAPASGLILPAVSHAGIATGKVGNKSGSIRNKLRVKQDGGLPPRNIFRRVARVKCASRTFDSFNYAPLIASKS